MCLPIPIRLISCSVLVLLIGCAQEGPMERAGARVDDAVEETQAVAEETAETLKDAAHKALDKAEEIHEQFSTTTESTDP